MSTGSEGSGDVGARRRRCAGDVAAIGRRQLARDAYMRLRKADGFSHARSLAFMLTLVLLEGIIGLVGLASVLGQRRFGRIVASIVEDAVPGPAGEVLTQTVRQAESAAASGQWIGLVFGLVGAIVTGTTFMGQTERALNRLYGIERIGRRVRSTAGRS